MTVTAWVTKSITFLRHSSRFLENWVLMMPEIEIRETAKSTAQTAKLIDVWLKEGKKNPNTVGVIRKLWAMSDNPPVAIKMTFLWENRNMLLKRIAQKALFFYHRYYMTTLFLLSYFQL